MQNSDDKKAWEEYIRSLKPVSGRSRQRPDADWKPDPGNETASRDTAKNKVSVQPAAPRSGKPTGSGPEKNVSLDHRRESRLRKGEIDIEARLDLHGMTQTQAHDALSRFLQAALKAERRNLLVVTGKGQDGQGVLRANLPGWLGGLPDAARILAVRPAANKHGGAGAFYVILRRAP